MSKYNSQLNVSLEPHLLELLSQVRQALPNELSQQLQVYISSPPDTIPHSFLNSISTWARTPNGTAALTSHNLPVTTYSSMVVLLAGCTTSPERHFPRQPGKYNADGELIDEAQRETARQQSERRAITALVNALLSIGGSAAAVWWAAQRLGWRDEWRVLLALFAAVVVAVAEGVLFVIWQSRKEAAETRKKLRRQGKATDKKDMDDTGENVTPEGISEKDETRDTEGLRQRTTTVPEPITN